MKISEFKRNAQKMTKEELYEISLQKIKSGPRKGCATPLALEAQTILYNRAGQQFRSSASWSRNHTAVEKF